MIIVFFVLEFVGTICPNATWATNGTLFISSNLNSTYWMNVADFTVDRSNNFYVIDSSSYRVLKYTISNPSVFTEAAITSYSSTYQPTALSLDNNGSIYTAEAWVRTSSSYLFPCEYSIVLVFIFFHELSLSHCSI